MEPGLTVGGLKRLLEREEGISFAVQCLVFGQRELRDERASLASYGVSGGVGAAHHAAARRRRHHDGGMWRVVLCCPLIYVGRGSGGMSPVGRLHGRL